MRSLMAQTINYFLGVFLTVIVVLYVIIGCEVNNALEVVLPVLIVYAILPAAIFVGDGN